MHTLDSINELIKLEDKKLDIYKIISSDSPITSYEYQILASILKVDKSDLIFPEYKDEDCTLTFSLQK